MVDAMVTTEIDHLDDERDAELDVELDVDTSSLAHTRLSPVFAAREEWVMTRRQQVTVFCALVLALATGVVAVALGLSLAA